MATPHGRLDGAAPQGARFLKIPIAVLVIASVELALGVLAVGLILQAQAVRSDAGPDSVSVAAYVSVFAYASCAALAAALGFLAVALFSPLRTRLLRLVRAHIGVAAIASMTAAGNLLVVQLEAWTTTVNCEGCDASVTLSPTAAQVVASIALDLGAGALCALLPVIVLLLLRSRREAASAALPAPPNAAWVPAPEPPPEIGHPVAPPPQ